jgi:hypothetical protein
MSGDDAEQHGNADPKQVGQLSHWGGVATDVFQRGQEWHAERLSACQDAGSK